MNFFCCRRPSDSEVHRKFVEANRNSRMSLAFPQRTNLFETQKVRKIDLFCYLGTGVVGVAILVSMIVVMCLLKSKFHVSKNLGAAYGICSGFAAAGGIFGILSFKWLIESLRKKEEFDEVSGEFD